MVRGVRLRANGSNKTLAPTGRQRRAARTHASWLLSEHPRGAGLSTRQLGGYMGKSCAWVHYLAAGKWDRIGFTREHARWLAALYVLERGRHKAAHDEAALVAEFREHLAQAIIRIDGLARLIAARRRKPQ